MRSLPVFVVLMVALFAAVASADTCNLSGAIKQPGLDCSSTSCSITSGTFPFPLPQGETYDSFYSWILGVIGTDGATVNAQYVDYTKADPNIYFTAGQTNCMVNLTFVYEVAFYRNSMGYFTFTSGSKPTSVGSVTLKPVFSETTVDCSRTSSQPLPGTSCLAPGSTISLGPFSSTQAVGFYLKQDSICSGTTTFYSVDALNKVTSRWKPIPAAHGRMVAVLRDPNTLRAYLGFEDAPDGSDSDYNDNVFSVTSNCEIDTSLLPCATVTTCRNSKQTFDSSKCTCSCPNPVTCTAPQVYSTDLCACTCPNATQTCTAPLTWNSATCQCDCPSTKPSGVTCSNLQQWSNVVATCGCKCPDPATYTCSDNRFVLRTSDCTCNCPSTGSCSGNLKWNSANSVCGCQCPSTPPTPCSGNLQWNSTASKCACECPATATLAGVTCKDKEVWDTASCSCKCPATASAADTTCPNVNYQWNYKGKCDCVCPATSAEAGINCTALGLGNTVWDTTACNCTCPPTGTCPGNKVWNPSNDPAKCGCSCPASAPAGKECKGNFYWNTSDDVCDCYCPLEAPADDPCIGYTTWNRTECDCYCPLEPPFEGGCPGVQVWDRDQCQCVCPDDDPCAAQSTACKQFYCSSSTGECALVYEDTCASQKLQFNTTGCLSWQCDPDLGCVRKANGSCCDDYKDCPTCAKYDGCDWIGTKCADSGQVLTSPIDQADHPDCFPSTGLSAGETAGITVGIVAGVTVGVGGAAGLFGAGYILYRMLNKPPPPEQLPTIENLDTEAGTDDNPLFHKNEIEMTNPMFSAAGAGGGGDAGAMFAQGGGASAVPADLHTL